MAYREEACDVCGLYQPKKVLHPRTTQVETERTADRLHTYASGHTTIKEGEVKYKTVRELLCPGCYNDWQEELRLEAEEAAMRARDQQLEIERKRLEDKKAGRRIGIVILSGIALLVLFAAVGRLVKPATDPANGPTGGAVENAESASENSTAVNAAENKIPTGLPETPASTTMSAPAAVAAPTPIPPLPAATAQPAAPEPPHNVTSLGLEDAEDKALATGARTPWVGRGSSGVVTVGAIALHNRGTCRTYAFSSGSETSSIGLACLSVDGEWHIEKSAFIPSERDD